MSIYIQKDKSILFKGNHSPAEFYKGNQKISGFYTQEILSNDTLINNTYNDNLTLKIIGNSFQSSSPSLSAPQAISSLSDIVLSVNGNTVSISDTLGSVGDCYDYIAIESNSVKKYQQTKEYSITGYESGWMYNTYSSGSYLINPSTLFGKKRPTSLNHSWETNKFICSHFPSHPEKLSDGSRMMLDDTIYIYIANISSLEEGLTFLKAEYDKGTPVTVRYALETPIITDLTDTEAGRNLLNLKMTYPQTKLSISANSNGANASFVAKYKNNRQLNFKDI